jgi:hypothetical protein
MIRAAAVPAFAFCLVCALAAGCAAPGEPVARHPVVPAAVTDLAARQYGDSFSLTFTLPAKSMDREALAEHPAIEIYRAALPPGSAPDRQTAWRLAYSIPSAQVDSYLRAGQIEFHDPLAAEDLAAPAGTSLAYKVRTRAVKVRASEDSNVVVARIYVPPDAPADVKTTVREDAIEISWTAPSAAANAAPVHSYRVYREELGPVSADQASPAKPEIKAPFALLGETEATQYQDRNFEFGRAYVYSVRSVAQYGSDAVESGQPESSLATVTPRDIFPPAAPTSLETTFVPATPGAPAYVELSWAISPEGDLAGYSVYRSEGVDSPGERVSTEILPSPTFRDMPVTSGRRYYYSVSAIDRAGNESPKSSVVTADVP